MSTRPRETSAVEHAIRIAATPETVFAYFTDPARMVQWMGADATLDPRPGGVCRIAFRPTQAVIDFWRPLAPPDAPDVQAGVMSGRFVEVEPPRRIVLTWGWEEEIFAVPPQSTAVEVSLTPEGDETVVRLIHRRLPAGEAVAFHRGGWDHYLPRLAAVASGDDPGADPWQADA